jgi:hypothetical protein
VSDTAAAPSSSQGRWAFLGRLSARLGRNRSAPVVDEREEITQPRALPTSYKTFSHKLAPSLTAIGGLLAIAGGLGSWVRTTRVVSEGLAAEQVGNWMGRTSTYGIAIAILGGAAAASSLIWFARRLLPKILPVATSVAAIVVAAIQLPAIDRVATQWASDAAASQADFMSFHAGLGWGGWLLIVSCVLLALGVVVGVLREIDVRRGVS